MPSQDYIKGKADIFSFVLEILNGIRKNKQLLSCGEIVDRIEHYVNIPLRDKASTDYNAGVREAMSHFRRYFLPRENIILSDAIRHIYNAVEEQFEMLLRLLDDTGPKMTLGMAAEHAGK